MGFWALTSILHSEIAVESGDLETSGIKWKDIGNPLNIFKCHFSFCKW